MTRVGDINPRLPVLIFLLMQPGQKADLAWVAKITKSDPSQYQSRLK